MSHLSALDVDNTLKLFSNLNVTAHTEDFPTLQENKHEGTHYSRRPPEAEVIAAAYTVRAFQEHNVKGTIAHVSAFRTWKHIPIDIGTEVTLHHALLDQKMIPNLAYPDRMNVNPALKYADARIRAGNMLLKRPNTRLGSDHAPHLPKEKATMSGLIGLENFTHAATTIAIKYGIGMQRFEQICSLESAKHLGLERGLVKGKPGCVTVINFTKNNVGKRDTLSKCGWNPWENYKFSGMPVETIIHGVPKMQEIKPYHYVRRVA
jgi:dihydroorotase-like cyclic amidohydrolase